jgi:CubicO group peptidase (beta-lactamase class C family)
MIVAVSLHGHRYFFPYGKATDARAPFTRETLVEIGSCTKTFTTTLFALAINRNQIVADAPAQKYMPNGYMLRAQQLTPLELADFTSGMPDVLIGRRQLSPGFVVRSPSQKVFHRVILDASPFEPAWQVGRNRAAQLRGRDRDRQTWEDQINSEILQPLGMADTTLRPSRGGGELIEVNPEATPLSEFATQRIRESAAVALPKIVDQVITS